MSLKKQTQQNYDILAVGCPKELAARINAGFVTGEIVSLVGGISSTFEPGKGIIYSQAVIKEGKKLPKKPRKTQKN